MPVGTRLEFVATAEDYAPKRIVVPAGAVWDPGADGKPRYEIAAQLEKSNAKLGTKDPWPPGEPGSEVGGQGRPGTVRVVSTPRGAEIWMLAGIGPEVRLDQVRCDQGLDVLVAGPTTFRKRIRVDPGQFVLVDGGSDREATVSIAVATNESRAEAAPSNKEALPPSRATAAAHGGLPSEAIRTVVVAHRGALQACYEIEAQKDPTLQGGVTVAWTIDPSGGVTTASLVGSTIHNARVEGCVLRQVRSWTFPTSDGVSNATFPFSFGVAK
jgi:hypothetical protein